MLASVFSAPLSLLPGATLSRAPAAPRGALVQMAGLPDPAAPVLLESNLRECLKRSLESNPKKFIALLGSTGSIGTQTLDICREYPDYFEVISLSAGANVELLAKQIIEFRPKVVGLAAAEKEQELRDKLTAAGVTPPEIVTGSDGQIAAAVAPGADTVVTGVVGCAGLLPTIEAIKLGRTIALANKETLISGGPVILPLLKKHGAVMTPADSEHSAIFQCLQGVPPDSLRRVILTASGGAFRDFSTEELLELNKNDPELVRKKATTHPHCSWWKRPAGPHRGQRPFSPCGSPRASPCTPERRLGGLEARRDLRSPPRLAPNLRAPHFRPPGIGTWAPRSRSDQLVESARHPVRGQRPSGHPGPFEGSGRSYIARSTT